MLNSKKSYFIAGIVPYIIWGTMSIPLRHLKGYPPEEILYYRIFASIFMMWACILVFRRKTLSNDLQYLKGLSFNEKIRLSGLTVLSAILITGNWFTYIYAVNAVSLKAAAFAYMVCPLITALCGFILLKEKLTRAKVIGLVVALISIVLLATGSLYEVLWAILIASFYALYIIILKVVKGIDKFNLLGVQLILSGLMILPLYFVSSGPVPVEHTFWLYIFLIAIVFTIIPLFLNAYALVGMPSSALGILIYLNPIVAFAVAFFYFREPIATQQLFAYLLLLVSIAIFNASLLKRITDKKA